MAERPLWQLTAAELVGKTRAGTVSAQDAVRSALDRMAVVNPRLNAVVEDLSTEAITRARALDAAVSAGAAPGPLHGVPVTIKVNVDQKGHATTNGVVALKDVIAPGDAPIVENLQAAGAVIIGRTNTPEFSFRADTDNPLHGRTHNPWGPHVSPGGSSGGAGAAVMAGIGALAHGNDIGGSLRFPAAANGAVTVKPGLGRVPAWNPSQTAERGMLAQAMSVQGLITRSARDLDLAMPFAVAPDPRDPYHVPLPYRMAPMEGPIKVAVTRQVPGFEVHPEINTAITRAADALANAGYDVEERAVPDIEPCALSGYRALMGEVSQLMGPDIAHAGSQTVRAVFDEYYRQFPPFAGADLLRVMADRTKYARQWSLFLHETPLVLTPFLPQPFFRPDRDTEGADGVREALGSALWSYSMNFIGLPAGNFPSHLAALPQGHQPINVQLIGPRWREDIIVDAMIAAEDRLGTLSSTLWDILA
jgi:amidase